MYDVRPVLMKLAAGSVFLGTVPFVVNTVGKAVFSQLVVNSLPLAGTVLTVTTAGLGIAGVVGIGCLVVRGELEDIG